MAAIRHTRNPSHLHPRPARLQANSSSSICPPGTISRALIILETLSSRLRKPSLNPDCESFL